MILDEFQRFRHLIDPNSGSAASELAHHLFNYRDAKVLLLSATPYKPYTTVAGDSEDDHYRDFMTTLEFLADGDAAALERIRAGFRSYRQAIIAGSDAVSEASELRDALLPFMSRSERPRLEEGRDLLVRRVVSDVPTPDDLRDYAALQSFRAGDRLAGEPGLLEVHPVLRQLHGGVPARGAGPAATRDRRGDNGVEIEHRPASIHRSTGRQELRASRLRECATSSVRRGDDREGLVEAPLGSSVDALLRSGQCVFAVLGWFGHEAPDLLRLVECSDVGGESAELRGGTADGRGIWSDREHSGCQEGSVVAARLRHPR